MPVRSIGAAQLKRKPLGRASTQSIAIETEPTRTASVILRRDTIAH